MSSSRPRLGRRRRRGARRRRSLRGAARCCGRRGAPWRWARPRASDTQVTRAARRRSSSRRSACTTATCRAPRWKAPSVTCLPSGRPQPVRVPQVARVGGQRGGLSPRPSAAPRRRRPTHCSRRLLSKCRAAVGSATACVRALARGAGFGPGCATPSTEGAPRQSRLQSEHKLTPWACATVAEGARAQVPRLALGRGAAVRGHNVATLDPATPKLLVLGGESPEALIVATRAALERLGHKETDAKAEFGALLLATVAAEKAAAAPRFALCLVCTKKELSSPPTAWPPPPRRAPLRVGRWLVLLA